MKQIFTTETFDNWFVNRRDIRAKVRVQARIDRAGLGNFGDCEPWVKACRKCASTIAQAIACILSSVGSRW